MKTLKLEKHVSFNEPDVWGNKSDLHFEPYPGKGIVWKVLTTGKPLYLPVTMDRVRNSHQNLCLEYEGNEFPVWEHPSALGFANLAGVAVYSNHKWSSYVTTGEMMEKLRPYCQITDDDVIYFPLSNLCGHFGNGRPGFTQFQPPADNSNELRIAILINYPGLGEFEKEYLVTPELLYQVFKVGAQGWPMWRRPIAKIWWTLKGSPEHMKRIIWPQDYSKNETLRLFAEHRLVDILGALACLKHGKLPVGRVFSYMSGHGADYDACDAQNFIFKMGR